MSASAVALDSGVVGSVARQVGEYHWPIVAIAASSVLSSLLWASLHWWIPDRVRTAGTAGFFVIFGQTLDGVTTIVGVDLLGFTEQVPLSRLVLEIASQLPTVSVLGTAWLLLVLKTALAVLLLFAVDPDADGPAGFTSLALVGAGLAGFWPGINNLLLQAAV